jgi:hypothetical protein
MNLYVQVFWPNMVSWLFKLRKNIDSCFNGLEHNFVLISIVFYKPTHGGWSGFQVHLHRDFISASCLWPVITKYVLQRVYAGFDPKHIHLLLTTFVVVPVRVPRSFQYSLTSNSWISIDALRVCFYLHLLIFVRGFSFCCIRFIH